MGWAANKTWPRLWRVYLDFSSEEQLRAMERPLAALAWRQERAELSRMEMRRKKLPRARSTRRRRRPDFVRMSSALRAELVSRRLLRQDGSPVRLGTAEHRQHPQTLPPDDEAP